MTKKSANDILAEYVKHAIDCKEFLNEMVELYKTIWVTNKMSTKWDHSKLVALRKGKVRSKVVNMILQHIGV